MTCSSRSKTARARSWNVFERRFRPILRADDTPLWEPSELPPGDEIATRHWWTVVDCDGRLYLSAGFRFVNRLAYVRCAEPWSDADQLIDYHYD
jgi:hypothetical protein